MRGMRQLAASDHAAPHGRAASAVAVLTCLAANALFCAVKKTSCPPTMPMDAIMQARLHCALVHRSVFYCYATLGR